MLLVGRRTTPRWSFLYVSIGHALVQDSNFVLESQVEGSVFRLRSKSSSLAILVVVLAVVTVLVAVAI